MTSHSYYVVMIDHGRRGLEAVVQPEITRREVIARIASGEYKRDEIEFIHFIDGPFVEDVTEDLIEAAAIESRNDRILSGEDLAAVQADHERDLRKHSEIA